MKKTFFTLVVALMVSAIDVCAQSVRVARIERDFDVVNVYFDLIMDSVHVRSNRALLYTPVLVNNDVVIDSLPAFSVYGRNRYYKFLREGRHTLSGRADETIMRNRQVPDTIHYHAITTYQPALEGANLMLRRREYGCCDLLKPCEDLFVLSGEFRSPLDTLWIPDMAYVCPQAEASKERKLSGRAFIDFPVNRTEIYPDYRNNQRELLKILATIDSVRRDADITVRSLAVKGFASPEGTYKNNERLAMGRTEALRQYVQRQYKFADGFIKTAYEPEDWDGLRNYVADSDLPHRTQILDMIDAKGDPDKKEAGIKAAYPQEYAHLLSEVYPALRHTDYTIQYTIVTYSDPAKIREVMRTNPQKLSLNELFVLAQDCEVGSEEFIEVFEMAVRLFPDDPIANLNAANTALTQRNLPAAKRYLDKAADSPQKTYAQGVLQMLSGDRLNAAEIIRQAAQQGVEEATPTLERLEKLLEYMKLK